MYLIYCHINKVNGKRYVGFTSYTDNPNKRWRNGLGYLNNHHKVFAAAIEKYGWDNFEHVVLEDNLISAKEAKLREQYWIAYYHTYIGDPNNQGYNATKGGEGANGRVMSQDEREYRRQLKLGTKASEETKKKMSQTRRGKPQNLTDKKLAQLKTCGEVLSEYARKKRKPVICLETGERWESITAAAKALGLADASGVRACLIGKTKTVKKLHLKYEDE